MSRPRHYDRIRQQAVQEARKAGIRIAFGLQQNDDTGRDEPGYCPLSAVGPAFVHTVIEVIEP